MHFFVALSLTCLPPSPGSLPHLAPSLTSPPPSLPPSLPVSYDVMDVYVGVDALSADNTWLRAVRPVRNAGTIAATAAFVRQVIGTFTPHSGSWR